MKTTSLIFLAMSLVLLVGGFITCKVAKSMADSKNVKIFDQNFNKNGDTVYNYDLSSSDITKLSLTFHDTDIVFHKTSGKSYIELKNFNVNSYSTKLSGKTVSVDGTADKLSSLIDFSSGGAKFKGLRYFFIDNPDPKRLRSVDIYISDDSLLKTITVTSDGGNVNIDGINGDRDYFVYVNKSDVWLTSIDTSSVAEISVSDGNVDINGSIVGTLAVNVNNGNVTMKSNGHYPTELISYDLNSVSGSVVYNNNDKGGNYKTTSEIQKSLTTIQTTGNIFIYDN